MSFSEWKTYQLGELLEVKYGKDHKALSEGKIPAYGSGGIMRYVDKAIYEEISILIPRKGSLNNIYYLDKPFWTVDTMFWTKVNQKLVDPKFLYYKLTTFNYSDMNVGSAVPSMTVPVLNEMEIVAPNLKTQQRIAFILSSLDDAIELNQQINKTLEEMAKAIFKEWFVDFNFPSTNSAQRPNTTGKFQETEIGKIPIGWKKGTIKDLLFHSKESVNPSKKPDEDFFHYSIPAYDEGNNPSIEKGSTVLSNKFQVKCNSILVSKLNPRFPRTWAIGEIEEERSICSTEFQVLVPRKPFYYSYGFWLFAQTFVIDKMKANATGTSGSHQRVRPQDILDIEITLPNDQVLKLYHDTVSAFARQIHDNKTENQSLSNLRDALLPKLMKGEININL